ncbi:MAG: Nif3-like dinuclear metal center hexameric protein [Abitibacteriaceae bacterium]|nr:Nif3-like dinuclear metal center hexameric protein [Abditibacteriaceae bacterium]
MPTVSDLIKAIDAKYPFARAESWDKTGLQIGDVGAEVRSVLVAHEVTEATIAEGLGHQALVVYHPLLFRPLDNLDFRNHTVRLAARCIAANLHVVAVHTALDSAPQPHALGDALAQSLDLQNIQVLQPSGDEALVKIVVFTPPEELEKVRQSLWDAGAGEFGNYDLASFQARGTGTYRPLPGANPYEGEVGKLEEADEWRLEVIVPERRRDAVVRAMLEAHPYEEVAYDVYPLLNAINPYGAARMGELSALTAGMNFDDYARAVGKKLNAPNLRLVRAQDTVRKVACVPGSGASYIDAAVRASCDCLVTGDIKHHDALKAQALGLSLIDTTHVATECAAIKLIADTLGATLDINVAYSQLDTNPFAAL